MSSIRIASLACLLALAACVSPPSAEGPVVHKTDSTPAPRNVWEERAAPARTPAETAPPQTTPAPANGSWGSESGGSRSGGSVREMVESYPQQR